MYNFLPAGCNKPKRPVSKLETKYINFLFYNGKFQVSSGKYKVDLTRILQCRDYPNAKLPSPLYARYVRYNRTQKVLNANYTLARDLDEVFKVPPSLSNSLQLDRYNFLFLQQANIFLQKWGDGGWKNSFAFELKDVCRQFIKFLKGFWIDFLTHFEVDDPENCPVRKVMNILLMC